MSDFMALQAPGWTSRWPMQPQPLLTRRPRPRRLRQPPTLVLRLQPLPQKGFKTRPCKYSDGWRLSEMEQ
jgi:hypothetical protein